MIEDNRLCNAQHVMKQLGMPGGHVYASSIIRRQTPCHLHPPVCSAVEHEDQLAGYAPLAAPVAAAAHARDAGPSIPCASIDLAPAFHNKQKAVAAEGVAEV